MSKEQPAQPAPPTPFNLDLSNSGRGVWLVKVPKYIQNFFEKAQVSQMWGFFNYLWVFPRH